MEYVLQTRELCRHYGHFKALDGLTMNVPKGAVYGFVGKNGAGKTTLIRLITGLQSPSSGEFDLYGVKHDDKSIHKTRHKIGAVIETPSIYRNMTAADNLKEMFLISGNRDFERIPELLKLVGLENTGKKKAKNFSLGMRQRLGLAAAMADDPDFLILDEPINGLDPQGIIEIRELILKLNRECGITVLISSHILDELSKLATHYGFINNGQMIKEISADELDKVCRKHTEIEVSDTAALSSVLDSMNVEYSVTDSKKAVIFEKLNVTDLVLALHEKNCRVNSLSEHDEGLENYFVNLVGGENNA